MYYAVGKSALRRGDVTVTASARDVFDSDIYKAVALSLPGSQEERYYVFSPERDHRVILPRDGGDIGQIDLVKAERALLEAHAEQIARFAEYPFLEKTFSMYAAFLIKGYESVNSIVLCDDGLRMEDLLELNHVCVSGKDQGIRFEYAGFFEENERYFYGHVHEAWDWFEAHEYLPAPYKAAGLVVRIVSHPQLFSCDANMRTACLAANAILLSEGRDPFIMTAENAQGFRSLFGDIRSINRNARFGGFFIGLSGRRLAAFIERHSDAAFLLDGGRRAIGARRRTRYTRMDAPLRALLGSIGLQRIALPVLAREFALRFRAERVLNCGVPWAICSPPLTIPVKRLLWISRRPGAVRSISGVRVPSRVCIPVVVAPVASVRAAYPRDIRRYRRERVIAG
jgi:hypothetical protein